MLSGDRIFLIGLLVGFREFYVRGIGFDFGVFVMYSFGIFSRYGLELCSVSCI